MSLRDMLLGKQDSFLDGRRARPPQPRGPVVRAFWRGAWRPVPKNQAGIKRLYMVGPLDTITKTPFGTKTLRRRRAKNRIAKQSRKVNRG